MKGHPHHLFQKVGGLPAPTPMAERPLNIPSLAWCQTMKNMIDLTNQSEGCFEGKVCLANAKATSVMTLLSNLMILTYANQGRGRHVGNSRLMEMIAAIDAKIVAFQPPCIPTDWQANQIVHTNVASPHTVHFLGDDSFDLGQRHEADDRPKSLENATLASRLRVRSFLHLWEKSGILAGKIRFADYRVLTYLTLDRAVIEIAKHYEVEQNVARKMGGRIPHTVVLAWTGTDIKTKINRGKSFGSIRPNHHTAVYDDHNPSADAFAWDVAQTAAHQIGELVQWFHGFIILFTGCADAFDLDYPGANVQIDAIPGGRSAYNMYSSELLKIMQNYGVVCFPCAKHDGFLGNMLDKYPKDNSNWGRVYFSPHPTLAVEMAHFMADAVSYSSSCV